eukprot:SAG11_NODE_5035_length_1684_cov_0.820189_3_plen_139_part_00
MACVDEAGGGLTRRVADGRARLAEKALVLRFMSLPFVGAELLSLTIYPWLSVRFGEWLLGTHFVSSRGRAPTYCSPLSTQRAVLTRYGFIAAGWRAMPLIHGVATGACVYCALLASLLTVSFKLLYVQYPTEWNRLLP